MPVPRTGPGVRPTVLATNHDGSHTRPVRLLVSQENLERALEHDLRRLADGETQAIRVSVARIINFPAYVHQVTGTGGYDIPAHKLPQDAPRHDDFTLSRDLLAPAVEVRTAFVGRLSLNAAFEGRVLLRSGQIVEVHGLQNVEDRIYGGDWFFVLDDGHDREARTELDRDADGPRTAVSPTALVHHGPQGPVSTYVLAPPNFRSFWTTGPSDTVRGLFLPVPLHYGAPGGIFGPGILWIGQYPGSDYPPVLIDARFAQALESQSLSTAARAAVARALSRLSAYQEALESGRDEAECLASFYGIWTYFPRTALLAPTLDLHREPHIIANVRDFRHVLPEGHLPGPGTGPAGADEPVREQPSPDEGRGLLTEDPTSHGVLGVSHGPGDSE